MWEKSMTDKIKTGSILIAEGAILPESLSFESEPYVNGWRLVKKHRWQCICLTAGSVRHTCRLDRRARRTAIVQYGASLNAEAACQNRDVITLKAIASTG
jgi:hypothetical protein